MAPVDCALLRDGTQKDAQSCYCAAESGDALLEVLVHAGIDIEDMPVNFR